MSKLNSEHDDYERTDGGLWLPKYGLRGPNRKHSDSQRFMSRRRCCKRGPQGEVECVNCTGTGNNAPRQFQVVIAGVADFCTGCTSYNATWIVTHVSGCNWSSDALTDDIVCGGGTINNIYVTLQVASGKLYVNLNGTAGWTSQRPGQFAYTFAGLLDCLGLDGFDGPWDVDTSPDDGWCDLSAATCEVTAL